MKKIVEKELEMSHTSTTAFLQCRRRYELYKEGWKTIETSPALVIGRAVHIGVEAWAKQEGMDEVHRKAQEEVGKEEVGENKEMVEETVYRCLEAYNSTYKNNKLSYMSNETPFKVPLIPGVLFTGRVDGLVEVDKEIWVLETKTSGIASGQFWPNYDMDSQSLGYVYAMGQLMEIEVAGVLVDLISKPVRGKPAKCERRRIRVEKGMRERWLEDMRQIALEVQRAWEEEAFYKSYQCQGRYGRCEYWEYCVSGNERRVLELTHKQETRG